MDQRGCAASRGMFHRTGATASSAAAVARGHGSVAAAQPGDARPAVDAAAAAERPVASAGRRLDQHGRTPTTHQTESEAPRLAAAAAAAAVAVVPEEGRTPWPWWPAMPAVEVRLETAGPGCQSARYAEVVAAAVTAAAGD